VAIINEAAASLYWPGQNPIGQRVLDGGPSEGGGLEIVGVVETGQYRSLGEEPKPALYECFLQGAPLGGTLVAHVTGAPGPALAAVRLATQEMDSRLALTRAMSLERHLTMALFPVRTSGMLLGALGVVALVLAVSGLFGVIAYSVSQRTREVAIRIALGAQQTVVQRMVLRQGMKLAGLGVILGWVGALALTRLLRHVLFGVSPTDPLVFTCIPVLLLAVAFLACWLPARRAARVCPMVALRDE
jgi:predicted lysophospholipase L1 biosynthesis ABC-type transport system permease subunit